MKSIFLRWAAIIVCFVGGYYIGKSQVVTVEVEIPTATSKEERANYAKMIQFLQDECVCWQKNYDAIAADNDLLRTPKP